MSCRHPTLSDDARQRLRLVFITFLTTFVFSRLIVFLIMARRIPDLFVHVGGTHVHHLNFGIFLLAIVGAYLLFASVTEKSKKLASVGYGIGLALTFDEFGMWLHLGGGYWQRASFDAIVVLAALLGLFAFAPPLRNWHGRQFSAAVFTATLIAVFYFMLAESFQFAARIEQRLQSLEHLAPN